MWFSNEILWLGVGRKPYVICINCMRITLSIFRLANANLLVKLEGFRSLFITS